MSARRNRVRHLPLFLALALASSPAVAQTDTGRVVISGVVIDPLRQPVSGAEVRVIGDSAAARTSPAGTFRLSVPRAKEILVQIRRPGYQAQLIRVTGDWSGNILLEPGVFELPDIQVTARNAKPAEYAGTSKYDDYFKRRRIGFGEFISREDIERRQPMRAVEILDGRTGIKVSMRPPGATGGTEVWFARCHEYPPKINVYVDGRKLLPDFGAKATETDTPTPGRPRPKNPLIQGMVGDMLDRVNPADIELVEIFRGPGELPGEFNDGNCGAISIWTRQGGR